MASGSVGSILNPEAVCRTIDVPPSWSLVAYLCVGFPIEEHADPELERAGVEAAGKRRRRSAAPLST